MFFKKIQVFIHSYICIFTKKCFFLYCLLYLSFIESSQIDLPKNSTEVFEEYMGRETAMWRHVQDSDFYILNFFENIFSKQIKKLLSPASKLSIPHTLHIIWIGPKPFPEESIHNIESWIRWHPNWIYKFWTDRPRPVPHRAMELSFIDSLGAFPLQSYFLESNNYGEKSDILRYEILHREGGVYTDHDVECFRSFEPLLQHFDFFCGLEPPHASIINGAITVCNNLIGSKPRHPILEKTQKHVQERWEKGKQLFCAPDMPSVISRVAYRTFTSFDLAVKELLSATDQNNIVFPAAYFNRLENKYGIYAHHQYATTWFSNETNFERSLRKRVEYIAKKNNHLLAIISALFLLQCVTLGSIIHKRYAK